MQQHSRAFGRGGAGCFSAGLAWRRLRVLACVWVTAVSCVLASEEDLVAARNAVHDKLFDVAVTHAESCLREVQARPAEGVEALQLLAQALAGQRKYDLMLQRLQAWAGVVQAAPDPGLFAFWRALGLVGIGKPREGIEVAEAALATGKSSVEHADALQRLIARARISLGEAPAALSLYAEVDKRTTNRVTRAENMLEWAQALEGVGRVGDALNVLVRQVEMNVTGPVTDDGRLAYGRLLARQQRPADAEAALRLLAQKKGAAESQRVQAWVAISQLALEGGRTNEALVAARAADELSIYPDSRKLAGYLLADLLLAAPATLDEGVVRMKAQVREFPDGPTASAAQFRLAEALLRNGRHEAAAAEYRLFLETFNDGRAREAAALEGLGAALFRLSRYGEAANVLLKAHGAATSDPVRVACLIQGGDALHAAGQFRQAADTYRRLVAGYAKDPLVPRALFQAADSLERAGDTEAAQTAFAQAAQRAGTGDLAVQALLRLAPLQEVRAQSEQAIETYTKALAMTTNATSRGEALLGRARTHYRTYHFETAAADFQAAGDLLPARHDEAEFLQTMCLYGQGRDEDARAAALAFLGTYTNSTQLPEMVLWLAKFDYNRNRLEEANRRLLQYVETWPRGSWADAAVLWAGRASFRAADYTNTVLLMSRLQREYPQSPRFAESRFVQGEALYMLTRYHEAVVVFDEIVGRYPDSDWVTPAWARKGDSLSALGSEKAARYDEAIKSYREVLGRRDATPEMILQAEFRIGRCLQKTQQLEAAIDQYYSRVVLRFLEDRQKGVYYPEAASSWFEQAAFLTAELLQQKKANEQAESILNRVIQANTPGREEAQQRIQRLRKGAGGK
jgi:TolA-binding protein